MTWQLFGEPKEIRFHWCGYLHSKQPWQHDERINHDYELMIGVAGNVHFEIAGQAVTLAPGNLLLIPPETYFCGVAAEANVGFYWLHFEMQGMQVGENGLEPAFSQPYFWQLPLFEKKLVLDNELLLLQQLQTIKEIELPTHQLLDAYTTTLKCFSR